jgi:hypothetical protein
MLKKVKNAIVKVFSWGEFYRGAEWSKAEVCNTLVLSAANYKSAGVSV